MSVLCFDGFDEYTTENDLWDYGNWYDSLGTTFSNSTALRLGSSGKYARVTGRLTYKLPNDSFDGAIYMGAAIFISALPASDGRIVSFDRTFSANIANEHASIGVTTTGELYVNDQAGVQTLTGTSIVVDTWYSLEVKFVRGAAGTIDIKLDGTLIYSFSGDTENGVDLTNSYINFISTGYVPVSTTSEIEPLLVDDFYCFDALGTLSNTWGGNLFVESLPLASDSSVAFTPLSGTNFSNIDEGLINDGDTTYVESTTIGHRDLYANSAPTQPVLSVKGVKVFSASKSADAGAINLKIGVKAGADEAQSAANAVTASYANYEQYFDSKDGGTTEFVTADLDALLTVIEVG